MTTLKLVGWSWLAGFVAGVAALYLSGPILGAYLQQTGAHLVGLAGDQGFTSARDAHDFIQHEADVAVSERAQRLLPPAIVRTVRR